ncbi:MAG: RsmB/NOP family class I SAM-dependent RNA methyltransferase, partial [Candidatus Omnitrophica bacterium]|nr:RsmB/NOP family class I SAM-dependent RNA methyltransferase [Candidatus Omnitrophota bacterium]MBD3268696.1 RsmB/NOP family class I SAM-dependent RNA methyltransferase [Candidatus Omnitrophota bacterium]
CLEPKAGDKILDLCAAPGAKTSQIASLSPESEIIAVEKVRPRYYKLLNTLKQQGADFVKTILIDGIWVRKKFPEYFDRILLDSPCSGEGRFFLSNPRSFKYWKMRKVKEMVHKQKKLMHSAFLALEKGGELVYSTCTFSPEENEGIIDWFINKFKEKVEILPLNFPLDNTSAGIKSWKAKRFSPSVRLCKRILPDANRQGFFIARIRKISF